MFGNGSKKSSKDKHKGRKKHSAISIVPRLIPLVIKLGFVYLSFKRKAKKAGKIFEKELLANGIDKNTAKLLKQDYLQTSHFLSSFDFSHMAKDRRSEQY